MIVPDGATMSVAKAAELLGISRNQAYELIRRAEFPVSVLRLGRRLRVPTSPLLKVLGIESGERGNAA